jgi:hypothetical protein
MEADDAAAASVRLQVRLSELKEEVEFMKQGLPVVDRAVVAKVIRQLESKYCTELELENKVCPPQETGRLGRKKSSAFCGCIAADRA